jgi:hypothetical protein
VIKLKGIIRYIELGMGFWAFEGADNSKWELFDLAEKYKKDGLKCTIHLEPLQVETVNMWGLPAKVSKVEK